MKPSNIRYVLRPTLLGLTIACMGMAQSAGSGLRLNLSHALTLVPLWHARASVQNHPTDTPARLALTSTLAAADTGSTAPVAIQTTVHWASRAQQWIPGQSPCDRLGQPAWDRLSLSDALALSLCKSPTLRQALANVAEQSAGVTLAETAKRPSWGASLGGSAARNFITGATNTRSIDSSLNLTWVLLDFGRSDANLSQARQTLAAALATQSNTLLDSVRELLQLYGEAVVADAAMGAAKEAEATAALTADAAQARYDAEVGTQIDRLQAQTALAQATLAKVRAESDWENARGKLALALGADITQPLRLANWEPWIRTGEAQPNFAILRQEARAQHPRLRAARAQLEALQAQLASVKAAGQGNVVFAANAGHASNWGNNGTTTTVSNVPSAGLSLTASIPLFNGSESNAQQARVLAQSNAQEAELEAIERDVDTQLWQAHRALITSAKSVDATERLLSTAKSTQEVAQGRYKAGVGSMVDLLTAQAALADARRQRVASLVDKLTAQTQLILATGRMGF
jgi:outer membrane protein